MKLSLSTLFCLFLLMGTNLSIAQDQELKITYENKLDTDNEEMKGHLAMMGKMEAVTYIKGKKVRNEQHNKMSGTTIAIFDGDQNKGILLMENPFLGKKYKEFNREDQDDNYNKVEATDEYQDMLGYKTRKYIVVDSEGNKTIIWSAEDLDTGIHHQYGKDFKGYPLLTITEMEQAGVEMTMTMKATEIQEEEISDNLFDMTVPEGYDEMKQ